MLNDFGLYLIPQDVKYIFEEMYRMLAGNAYKNPKETTIEKKLDIDEFFMLEKIKNIEDKHN